VHRKSTSFFIRENRRQFVLTKILVKAKKEFIKHIATTTDYAAFYTGKTTNLENIKQIQ
jgi:hypothetical protein